MAWVSDVGDEPGVSGMWKRRRKPTAPDTLATAVANEVEAFLNGGIRDLFRGHMELVPPWAAINTLAHGDLAHLQDLATGASPDGHYQDIWASALAVLAREILDIVGTDRLSLRELQYASLVPLESRLFTEPEVAVSPGQLVILGRAQLRRRPSTR